MESLIKANDAKWEEETEKLRKVVVEKDEVNQQLQDKTVSITREKNTLREEMRTLKESLKKTQEDLLEAHEKLSQTAQA